jgi:hypothetical protein
MILAGSRVSWVPAVSVAWTAEARMGARSRSHTEPGVSSGASLGPQSCGGRRGLSQAAFPVGHACPAREACVELAAQAGIAMSLAGTRQ